MLIAGTSSMTYTIGILCISIKLDLHYTDVLRWMPDIVILFIL